MPWNKKVRNRSKPGLWKNTPEVDRNMEGQLNSASLPRLNVFWNFITNAFTLVQILWLHCQSTNPTYDWQEDGRPQVERYNYQFLYDSLMIIHGLEVCHLPTLRRAIALLSAWRDLHGPEWRGATRGETRLHAAAWKISIIFSWLKALLLGRVY